MMKLTAFLGEKNKSQLNYFFFMIFFKALTKQCSLLEYVSLRISLTTFNLEGYAIVYNLVSCMHLHCRASLAYTTNKK